MEIDDSEANEALTGHISQNPVFLDSFADYKQGFFDGYEAAKQAGQPDNYRDLIERLEAVPINAFLRLPTGATFIDARLPIGEMCREAANALSALLERYELRRRV